MRRHRPDVRKKGTLEQYFEYRDYAGYQGKSKPGFCPAPRHCLALTPGRCAALSVWRHVCHPSAENPGLACGVSPAHRCGTRPPCTQTTRRFAASIRVGPSSTESRNHSPSGRGRCQIGHRRRAGNPVCLATLTRCPGKRAPRDGCRSQYHNHRNAYYRHHTRHIVFTHDLFLLRGNQCELIVIPPATQAIALVQVQLSARRGAGTRTAWLARALFRL